VGEQHGSFQQDDGAQRDRCRHVGAPRAEATQDAGEPEHRDEGRLREGGELANRSHLPRLQTPRRRRADAPHALHRQRVQELELAVGGYDDQAVRLRDAAGHLREELRPGDADRDG